MTGDWLYVPMTYQEPKKSYLEVVILSIIGLVVITPIARCVGRTAGETVNQQEMAAVAPVMNEVRAVVSSQANPGLTENQMDEAWLSSLAEYSRGRIVEKATPKWDQLGVPQSDRLMTAEPVLLEVSGKKLGIIRFRQKGVAASAMIVGLRGNEFVRIMCVNNELRDVVVTSGVCGEKVSEVFGVSFSGKS